MTTTVKLTDPDVLISQLDEDELEKMLLHVQKLLQRKRQSRTKSANDTTTPINSPDVEMSYQKPRKKQKIAGTDRN